MAIPHMPDRTITVLALTAGALFTVYLVLVIVTVSLATVQTALAADVRVTEGAIASQEATYFDAIAKQNTGTPASAGLVAPVAVEYASAKTAPGISFVGR